MMIGNMSMPLQSSGMQEKNMPWITNCQVTDPIQSNEFSWQQQSNLYRPSLQNHQLMPINQYNNPTYIQDNFSQDNNYFIKNDMYINNANQSDSNQIMNFQRGNIHSINQLQQQSNLEANYNVSERIKSKKRNSFELDDESIHDRPVKQFLSEAKLFKKFETIHLDKDNSMSSDNSSDSDDSLEDNISSNRCNDLNHYVYNLYNNKTSDNNKFTNDCNCALIRLAREEREKLNKALVLYSPPSRYNYTVSDDNNDCDDEKSSNVRSYNNDTLTITDVTNEFDIEEEILPKECESTAQSYYEMEY